MKKLRGLCKFFSALLAVLLFCVTLMATLSTANAASITKVEKSYEIALVFDNSGSMYANRAWCRAKYAMEIFASMLNYDKGDKLQIFPMWEITTDGSKPDSGGSYSAVEINDKNDLDKISNLYTVHPSNTPFEPITEAHNYLKSSTATEKWMVVLTDGEFNQNTRNQPAAIDLQSRLSSLASNNIKVQYLGFGKAQKLNPDEAKGFYAKQSSDTSLKDDLIGICNLIFQRSILPHNRLNGTSLEIDLSMKNLIVFVQGPDAKISSLTDESGKEVRITLDSGQRKYSDIRAKGYENAPLDNTLAGQVVTFAECPKGKYTLNYSNSDTIQVFYEPDVDIQVTLMNSDGEVVDPLSGEIIAGEYTVSSAIVDSSTKEDVTHHKLMGSDVILKTFVKPLNATDYTSYPNGAKIKFEPDSSTEVYVEGTYLKKYKISTRNDPSAFPMPLAVKEPITDFEIETTVLQPQSWYKIKDHAKWNPIKVSMTVDDHPLTDEQLANTKITVEPSGDLPYWYEPVPGGSAYNIYIGRDENGKYIEPEKGKYKIKTTAAYTDEFGKENKDEDIVSCEIQRYSKFWRWLFWVLMVLAVLTLINMILNHPTLPAAVYLNISKSHTCQSVKINGTSMNLSTDLYPGEIRCEAKPCTPLKNRRKTSAKFEIKSLSPGGGVKRYSIDQESFRRTGSGKKYVNDDGQTIEEMRPRIKISDETELKWVTNQDSVTGKIYINHN